MKKMNGFAKVYIAVALVVVALIGVAAWLVIDGNNKATNYNDYNFYSVIGADESNGGIGDHVKGDANAPVLIFEYADYQCPGCATMNPRVNKAVEEADGKLAVVYRSFLLSYHKNGTAAASVAEAAGLQGYWKPYADKLFAEQENWENASVAERTEIFKEYFDEVTDGKGDLEKFVNDMGSEAVSKKISFDMGIARRVNVEATPAFYVEGQLIDWNDAGSVTVNGETISWEKAQSGEDFVKLLNRIADTANTKSQ